MQKKPSGLDMLFSWGYVALGAYYYKGVRRNHRDSRRFFQKAASLGNVGGQIGLGLIYLTGRSVKRDNVEAHKWFTLASLQSRGWAAKYLTQLEKNMTAEEIAEAQARVRDWQERFAESLEREEGRRG